MEINTDDLKDIYKKTNSAKAFFHLINSLATGESIVYSHSNGSVVSPVNFVDSVKELSMPMMLLQDANEEYHRTNQRMSKNMEALFSVLLVYLKEKNELPVNLENFQTRFRYPDMGEKHSLQFFDFFIVEQAYLITEFYLNTQHNYGYDNEGLVSLSAKVAVYLFDRINKHGISKHYEISNNMSKYPSGFYYFSEETNPLRDVIIPGLVNTDGIWEFEDDEEEDEEDDF
ncbi:hypothetical protein [Bacillus velezensis]|uniref:hypothetical protein n=1 Tax=Bacillus velezensis TaxID=492670 RepID=UPI001A91161D|nr:hypothetical protein [Bacillus velezensis]BCT30349.1 hypothetical protein BVAD3_40230 [Bacillus velezensis]